MKQRARIDKWWKSGDVLVGMVSGHPRQSEFLMDFQRTSRLVRFEPEKNEAETLNTIYELGEPA